MEREGKGRGGRGEWTSWTLSVTALIIPLLDDGGGGVTLCLKSLSREAIIFIFVVLSLPLCETKISSYGQDNCTVPSAIQAVMARSHEPN